VLTTLFSGSAYPALREQEDRTLSPFFFVKSESSTVKQPLPLPQGVSDQAVGGNGKVAAFAPFRPSAQLAPAEPADSSHPKRALLKNEEKDKEKIFCRRNKNFS
jgi:hypothetical protein